MLASEGVIHEYQRRLFLALKRGVIDTKSLSFVDVKHDDWCGVYKHKLCNCDPEISITASGVVCYIDANGAISSRSAMQ